jgi:DNA replication protein DnaC
MESQALLESYLRHLHLPAFLQNYQAYAQDAARNNLSNERFLLALCEAEVQQREAKRIAAAVAYARVPVRKDLASFDFSLVQGITKARVLELMQGGYMTQAESIILIGIPGLGKTHIATVLALAACQQGKRVRFWGTAKLVETLETARKDLRLSKFLAQLTRHDLIVLDEFGFLPFSTDGAQLLFQVCSELYERVSILLTTNLRFKEWNTIFGDERMTAAFLDRLTHKSHIIEFLGDSYRFRQRLLQANGIDPVAVANDLAQPPSPLPS